MNYKLIIPSGESTIHLGTSYGAILLHNGQIIPESALTKSYPDLFHALPEINPTVEKWKNVLEKETSDNTRATLLESVETPVKRKPGRPFSKNIKKG